MMKQFPSFLIGFILLHFAQSTYANQTEILFAYIGNAEHPAYNGITLGLHEANIQGQFLGQKYAMETFASATDMPDDIDGYLAIISALPADDLLLLLETARQHPVFNLIAENDELRNTCYDNLLSIIPSDKMKQDASAQWQRLHPDAEFSAMAWHPNFNKFAARDLNKRFRKAFEKGMDDYAWAGWAAIRMSADTVAREEITDPVALLKHMKTSLSFDGQKGLNMNFRETGQLRQLILIVENNKPVGEAPVRGISNDIDSLGIPECVK
jgi:hypothetical protein